MKLLYLVLLTLVGINELDAQVINGRVIAESGMAAGRVNVAFRNAANRVITNNDGTFSIKATRLPDTLDFSAEGMEPYNVVVTEKTLKDPNFEIVLLNKRAMLNEVVVTAVGSKSVKKELGYSTTKIRGSRTETGLAGSVPGVTISSGSTAAFSKAAANTARTLNDKKLYTAEQAKETKDSLVYRSGVLTAGEVNDFNKWKMWEDFSENDFKVHSNSWKIKTTKRYSVQVVNNDKRPAINKKVELINQVSNEVIWTAVTDNTGKAELWADGMAGNENDLVIRCQDQYIKSPAEFSNGVNQVKLNEACNVSNKVDIAFVVDATGSMGDEIEFLKLELEDVIRKTFDDYKHLELNVASVFYRDWMDAYLTKKIDFQTDLLKVLNFVKLQQADGGGNEPEAVYDALKVALDSLSWSSDARARIMFLVLDAPPHEHTKEQIALQIKQAAAMGIRIIPIVCSGAGKSTEYLMRTMALATNGTYSFLTDDSGVGLEHTKPTTDAFKVEFLNGLLQRLIKQMITIPACNENKPVEPLIVHNNIEKIKIYPNPTRGNLVIESDKNIRQIFVTDFTGKILMNLAVNAKQKLWKADISRFPSGTYLVKYVTDKNEWGAEKVLLLQ